MIVFTDPIIISITLIVIVLVLIVGGIVIAVKKSKQNSCQQIPYQTPFAPVNIITEFEFKDKSVHDGVQQYLSLARDYSTPLANFLIAVVNNGEPIGYLKADIAQLLAPMMDSGVRLQARALEYVFDNNNMPVGCKIQVYSV